MNIFILDEDPEKAAEYHCDKHVVKMILEAGQMLCTAHWMSWLWYLGKERSDFKLMRDVKAYLKEKVPKEKQPPWGITHVNHPCSVWTRETRENYIWHHELMGYLLDEYTKRYKKRHKSEEVWRWLILNQPLSFPNQGLSPFPICMKDEYKISDNPVECYREYYVKDKVRFAKWKTQPPTWWITHFSIPNDLLVKQVEEYLSNVIEKPRPEFSGLPACPFVKKERSNNMLMIDVFDRDKESFLDKMQNFTNSSYTDALFAQPMRQALSTAESRSYQNFLNKLLKKHFKQYKAIVVNPNDKLHVQGFSPRKLAPCFLIIITDKKKLYSARKKMLNSKYFNNFNDVYLKYLQVKRSPAELA